MYWCTQNFCRIGTNAYITRSIYRKEHAQDVIETTGSEVVGGANAAGAVGAGSGSSSNGKGASGRGSNKNGSGAAASKGSNGSDKPSGPGQEREEPDGSSQDIGSGFDERDRVEPDDGAARSIAAVPGSPEAVPRHRRSEERRGVGRNRPPPPSTRHASWHWISSAWTPTRQSSRRSRSRVAVSSVAHVEQPEFGARAVPKAPPAKRRSVDDAPRSPRDGGADAGEQRRQLPR